MRDVSQGARNQALRPSLLTRPLLARHVLRYPRSLISSLSPSLPPSLPPSLSLTHRCRSAVLDLQRQVQELRHQLSVATKVAPHAHANSPSDAWTLARICIPLRIRCTCVCLHSSMHLVRLCRCCSHARYSGALATGAK